MKFKWIVALTLVVVLLSACSMLKSEPATDQTGDAYPSPGGGAYPGPAALPVDAGQPAVLYPGPADGDEVYWGQLEGMILNGEVKQVMQTHDLKVTILLKDGRTLFAYEPEIDFVFTVIERCGDKCKDIEVATE